MYYYTTASAYNYPYTWSTTSGSSSTSYTYKPNNTYDSYDCSGWITHVTKKPKGLDANKITEDAIMRLLRDDDE